LLLAFAPQAGAQTVPDIPAVEGPITGPGPMHPGIRPGPDRDYFRIPDEEIPRIRSLLTVIGGEIKHDSGFFGRHHKDDDAD
jgi:hypothetical protein